MSTEEALVLRKVGERHGVGKHAIGNYKTETEALSIRAAQNTLIKGLRKKAKSLEALNSFAKSATTEIREQAMQNRFELFVGKHPLNLRLVSILGSTFQGLCGCSKITLKQLQ